MENELPFKAKYAISYINDLVEEHQTEVSKLNDKINFLISPPKNKPLLSYKSETVQIKNTIRNSFTYKDETTYLVTSEDLKKLQLEDDEIHAQNLKIVEENKKSLDTFIKILQQLGLPKSKRQYKSNRSRSMVDVECAWVQDVKNLFTTHNPVYNVESLYRDKVEDVKKHEQQEIEKSRKQKDDMERLEKENSYKVLVARIVKTHNLPEEHILLGANELRFELARKNKYLYLAHFLSLNRGDWSDGCSYANTGLDNFEIEKGSVIDVEIHAEISGLIQDWDGDGRCFRDCNWNYDKIFNLVAESNKALWEDYFKLGQYETVY